MSEVKTLDEAQLNDLKSKHGELFQLRAERTGDVVIVKKAPEPLWKRFRTQMMDPAKKPFAPEQLLRDCIVFPDRETVDAMLARMPGLVDTFTGELAEINGAGQSVEKKAL